MKSHSSPGEVHTPDKTRVEIVRLEGVTFGRFTFEPGFKVYISDSFKQKMKAVKAFKTQFFDPNKKDPETFISSPEFLDYLISRSQFYGFQIGKHYGEPFYCEEKTEYDLKNLLR